MKRLLASALLLCMVLVIDAQNYPSEWRRFTTDDFYSDVESAATKQDALDLALSNLARQIQVKVKEVSQMDKNAVNGRSSVLYSSSKSFSTDVDMSLVESKNYYDESQGKYYVIVYLDKEAACIYYENEVKMLLTNVGSAISTADNYVKTGFKSKAREELQGALRLFEGAGNPFFWLNVFGFTEYRLQNYLADVREKEQIVKRGLADLEYGTTYCVVCQADLFGSNYSKLAGEIKGDLSDSGCNFVDDPLIADYVIRISAAARRYNTFQGAYFTYVDAKVAIDKTATGQRIYEDEISVKGSHTLSYDEAARDGYKTVTKEIKKMLKDNIKL